ncbi:MAG: transcription elongation factor GreA [Rickettsia sp.]|nr:transcription elongation factor GreA [Rickettsia sp.]
MPNTPITQEGFEELKAEIKNLKYGDRLQVIQEISVAREFGDLSENAEYKAAKEKQNFIEKKILQLERILSNCEIIDTKKLSNETVKFGAYVKLIALENEILHEYRIVGEYEANLKNNKISIMSPLAKSLIKKSVNDHIKVYTPKGIRSFKILEIKY